MIIKKLRMTFRSPVIHGFALALLLPFCSAQAQTKWPQRPVTMVVSQPGGASPDVMARMISDRIAPHLGQSMVIENKPGGGNVIGALAVARATPDGYTLYFATSAAMVLNPFLMENLPYDPLKDFVPIAFIARSHQLLVAGPNVSASNLREFIELDRKTPGKLSIAIDGPRNLAGIIAASINLRAGTNFVMVPYSNINSGVQDVMAGRVEAGVFSISIVEALMRDGKLKPLALVADQPVAALPKIPLAKTDIPGLEFGGWFMILAPTGTPPAIVSQLNAAVGEALRDKAVTDLAPKLGFDLGSGARTPEAASAFLKREYALWRETIDKLGIKRQ